jgi:Fe-S cluster assembly iron-binding protein IscA
MQLIEFTPAALAQIKAYRKSLMVPSDYALRVGIKQKNASDKGLIIGFDVKTDKDREIEVDGIKIIYNAGQVFFFAGMVIDFIERNDKKGFVLIEKSKLV